MRLKKLFLLDMRFQAKYGFYFLYVVLTVIYIAALFALRKLERKSCRNFNLF